VSEWRIGHTELRGQAAVGVDAELVEFFGESEAISASPV
jgi:hypothetical protein